MKSTCHVLVVLLCSLLWTGCQGPPPETYELKALQYVPRFDARVENIDHLKRDSNILASLGGRGIKLKTKSGRRVTILLGNNSNALRHLTSLDPERYYSFPDTLVPATALRGRLERMARDHMGPKKALGLMIGLHYQGEDHVLPFGQIERKSDRPPNGETVYEIASLSKLFTALLLARLAELGRVNLDDPITKHLPQTVRVPSKDGKEIVLRQLATHTSGLPRVPNNAGNNDPKDPYAAYSKKKLYAFLNSHELKHVPGRHNEYSNLGAGLLGHTLACLEGEAYEQLVIKHLCHPMRLRSTRQNLTGDMKQRLAPPHDREGRRTKPWRFDSLAGCGALRSTANDMLRFIRASLSVDASALSSAIALTQKRWHGNDPSGGGWGLGWGIQSGGKLLAHSGGTGGYCTFIAIHLKEKVGVIVLSNKSYSVDQLGFKLIHILSKEPVKLFGAYGP